MNENALSHSAGVMKCILDWFQWNIFDHPAYRPDLRPSNFNLFPELKKWQGGQSFHTGDKLQDAVNAHQVTGSNFNIHHPAMLISLTSD